MDAVPEIRSLVGEHEEVLDEFEKMREEALLGGDGDGTKECGGMRGMVERVEDSLARLRGEVGLLRAEVLQMRGMGKDGMS